MELKALHERFQRVINVIKPGRQNRTNFDFGWQRTRLARFGDVPLKEARISAEGSLGIEFLKFVEAELPNLAMRFAQREQ